MERLIQSAQSGNRSAWEELLRRYYRRAFAIALSHLGNHQAAEDATQEAFVEAYLRLPQLTAPAAFPVWLERIVYGKCIRLVRGGKRRPTSIPLQDLTDAVASTPTPEGVLLQESIRETLRLALTRLSSEEREALILFAVGGFSYHEIGERLGLTPGLVKKRLYTARQRLQRDAELQALRPALTADLLRRVEDRVRRREERKERQMSEVLSPPKVELVGPGAEYRTVIKNLYAFYRYELLMFIDGEPPTPAEATEENWTSGAWVNQHGVINGLHSTNHDEGVQSEDVFWERPNLQAFLIRRNGWPAGFAMVASPPNATRGVDYRLQEFFVINKARRAGVGTEAARQLFDLLPGKWELAYEPRNTAAVTFWRTFLPAYTGGSCEEDMIGMGWCPDMPGYVFTAGAKE